MISSDSSFNLTKKGDIFFIQMIGLNLEELKQKNMSFSRKCLYWSDEHRHHLAESLGNALMQFLMDNQYIKKDSESRSISIIIEIIKYFNNK